MRKREKKRNKPIDSDQQMRLTAVQKQFVNIDQRIFAKISFGIR